jgi:hypothetical protein
VAVPAPRPRTGAEADDQAPPGRPEARVRQQSRLAADAGDPGINSTYAVDTAKEVQSGRGGTLSALHGSEVAFWDDIEGKLTGLLESVPEDPDTLVVLESTAKGFNEFYDRWDDAWNGRSEYIPFFSARGSRSRPTPTRS